MSKRKKSRKSKSPSAPKPARKARRSPKMKKAAKQHARGGTKNVKSRILAKRVDGGWRAMVKVGSKKYVAEAATEHAAISAALTQAGEMVMNPKTGRPRSEDLQGGPRDLRRGGGSRFAEASNPFESTSRKSASRRERGFHNGCRSRLLVPRDTAGEPSRTFRDPRQQRRIAEGRDPLPDRYLKPRCEACGAHAVSNGECRRCGAPSPR